MPTTTPTILDQIGAEKTKVSERLARLDTDRATVATQLTDLETAERVLMRVSKTPPARRPTSAAAAEARAPTATRGRGRPPKAATSKSAGREPNAPSLGERVLALATGRTRQELYLACPTIARTISASQCSAISVPDGSRSATASCMRHRPRRPPRACPTKGRGVRRCPGGDSFGSRAALWRSYAPLTPLHPRVFSE
jgi:hypothetical protein